MLGRAARGGFCGGVGGGGNSSLESVRFNPCLVWRMVSGVADRDGAVWRALLSEGIKCRAVRNGSSLKTGIRFDSILNRMLAGA